MTYCIMCEKIDEITLKQLNTLDETMFGYSIPIISIFKARGFPIIGTNLDYFIALGGKFDDMAWRAMLPDQLFNKMDTLITKRLEL